MTEPAEHIRTLENCIATGDIAGMARVIGLLHEKWDDLPENTRQDVLKLESIFLSMVDMTVGGNA